MKRKRIVTLALLLGFACTKAPDAQLAADGVGPRQTASEPTDENATGADAKAHV